MKTADARRAIEAARAKAEEMGLAVTILVMDAQGTTVLLDRAGEPPAFTSIVADGKAYGGMMLGRTSREVAAMAERNPAFVASLGARFGGRIVPAAGSVLLKRDEELAGAIAVSGATADQDEEIAQAGADAF